MQYLNTTFPLKSVKLKIYLFVLFHKLFKPLKYLKHLCWFFFKKEIENKISVRQYSCKAYLITLVVQLYILNICIVLLSKNYFDQDLLFNFIG